MRRFTEKEQYRYFKVTIKEAEKALKEGNYPIGALIVDEKGKIVTKNHNRNSSLNDVTAHAEMLCLRDMGNLKLSRETGKSYCLYTSLEPCGGCGFFIARTNIKMIYAVTFDPHPRAATGTLMKLKKCNEVFKELDLKVGKFEDLALRSRHLMQDYLISKGKTETAMVYK